MASSSGGCGKTFYATNLACYLAAQTGQRVCLVVRELIPANAPPAAQDVVTLSATVSYSGAAAPPSVTLTQTDTTTVVPGGDLTIVKQVRNITQSGSLQTSNNALPGDTLQYQLTVSNEGSAALSSVVVNDTTPPFTVFVATACPASLPANLSGCTVNSQPAPGGSGALQWTFGGTLASGAQIVVTYNVTVAQ